MGAGHRKACDVMIGWRDLVVEGDESGMLKYRRVGGIERRGAAVVERQRDAAGHGDGFADLEKKPHRPAGTIGAARRYRETAGELRQVGLLTRLAHARSLDV